jgi:hypothetical protein
VKVFEQSLKAWLATENTEITEMKQTVFAELRFTLLAWPAKYGNPASFSVFSVNSDVTTSHSTRLSKDASQVAGYVA